MDVAFETNMGKVEVRLHFPITKKIKRQIQSAIKTGLAEGSQFENVNKLLKTLKSEDPVMGTPRGALLAYKHAKDWTQKVLSEKTGISQPDISKMLNGKRSIGLHAAKKLGKAFGIDYHKFI